MLKRTLVGVAAALLFGACATTALANHSWGGYHWGRTTNSIRLTVIDTTSSNWTSYVNTAISDWGSSHLSKTTGTASKQCRPVAGKVQVCNASYGNTGWLGVATIWIVSGSKHIGQATTKVNDTYFNTSFYNNPNEKRHVMCQELGHDFGLDHQDTSGADFNSCMDYFRNTGANAGNTDSTHPNTGDYQQLLCIYEPFYAGKTLTSTTKGHTHSCTGTGHLDSSNTINSAAIAQAPGSGVIVSHQNGMTQISIAYWANPIH
jgi:hypothetical protein